MIGGLLFVHADWHSIFWLLDVLGAVLWVVNWRRLPETLHVDHVQPFEVRHLLRGYWQLGGDPRFLALALASYFLTRGLKPLLDIPARQVLTNQLV